ncbi:MAG: IS1634 family transposase [Deltaproteobacteria bacterium]|nr:IS1634 family transposase [Deltaproteobacteria bacterium]
MYIERVPNRNSPPCILLRESYRQEGKVKKRTICNVTKWPPELVENFRLLLKGGTVIERLEEAFDIVRSRPYGHVAAVLGTLRKIGLDRIIGGKALREHALSVAMIVARIIDPQSKLATARGLKDESLFSALGEELGVEEASEDELYAAMDWLGERQECIERKLAKRHLDKGSIVLYDVTSTYFEGRTCPLARHGHNRDGKKGKLQIVFGLLCNHEGCPVAVEVFSGDKGDPSTLEGQITKIRNRFGLDRVIFVGDRGLITEAGIREEIRPVKGLEWITALRASQIRKLVESGSLQLSLFDEKDLAEITDPAYPAERLVVCRNPILAEERARKRRELLEATERELEKIVQATKREKRPLKGKDKIALRVGKVINEFKVGKHFHLSIGEESFSYKRKERNIAREEVLDGIYVIRTSLSSEKLTSEATVAAYKQLSLVEQAFRCFKSIDLKVRPIHHRLARRVRAHVFLCMLAYYVEWHMRRVLAPILFDEDDPQGAEGSRSSVVAPAQRSSSAQVKTRSKRSKDNLPVHGFRSLLKELATICKNRIRPKLPGAPTLDKSTLPTAVQEKALKLLWVRL